MGYCPTHVLHSLEVISLINKPSTVLEKLAAYEAAMLSTQPLCPIVIFTNEAHFVEDGYLAHIDQLEQLGIWMIIEIKVFNYMSALKRPGRLIVARKC